MLNRQTERRLCGMIGIAAKAGKIQSGEFSTEKSVKSRRGKLCIVARDASEATKKHFQDMCSFRNIPIYTELMDKEALGHIIGKGMRASITVEDSGFAGSIIGLIEGGHANE